MSTEQEQVRAASASARQFEGKVALVTGGSDGIGAATARVLSAAGAAVAINYHNDDAKAEGVVKSLQAEGGRAIAVKADVTDGPQVQALVEQVTTELGPIDVLVANASGLYTYDVLPVEFADVTWEYTQRIVERRITSLFFPLKAVLPQMVERRSGSVVVVASSLSRVPAQGMFAISMGHAAVDAGIRSLAREVGPHGVRINAVAPNFVLTEATAGMPDHFKAFVAERSAVRRNGLPDDVAETIAFLASDKASYHTGSYVVLDGGTAML